MKSNCIHLSVIISNYNYGRYIQEAIESILSQDCKNLEIIVVNDGSTDNSHEILKSYGSKIKYINQKNLGQPKSLNKGLDIASGKYIGFCDADDKWLSNKFSVMQHYLERDSTLDLAMGYVKEYYSDELNENQKIKFKLKPNKILGNSRLGILYRRTCFEKFGYFDTHRPFTEHIAWYNNALKNGLKYIVIDDLIAMRRVHGKNLTYYRKKEYSKDMLGFLRSKIS